MASIPLLHPSIRERLEPRMSATALAEYLILQADGQENILHDSRFASTFMVAANAEALRALRTYNCDPRRDQSALDKVKDALRAKFEDLTARPKARDEARRCFEAIDLFLRGENALGMRSMALRECPQFQPLTIEGVVVSIKPDLFVDGPAGRIGSGIIRVAKSPDPHDCKMDATRKKRGDHRREMAHYMVALQQMLLEDQGAQYGQADRDLCFVVDVRLGERIGPAPDHAVRLRAIRGACRQISSLWPDIEPKPSVLLRRAT